MGRNRLLQNIGGETSALADDFHCTRHIRENTVDAVFECTIEPFADLLVFLQQGLSIRSC